MNRRPQSLVQTPVGVEKLPPEKFAETKSRQDALQTIFSGRLDIFYFYPLNFWRFEGKATFSTPTPVFAI